MGHEPVDTLPLVGRAGELRAIRTALTDPHSRGVLIAGTAGVGKTRLAQEAASHLEDHSWRLLAARTSGSAAHLPLAALAGLIPPVAGGGARDSSLGPVQRALFGLRRLVDAPRAILFVDDAHLLDEVSATVVHQVVAEGTLRVLATSRTEAPVPDAVTALWKDTGVRRVDLRPLPPPDVDALVVAALEGPVEGGTLRELREAAAGNPLLLRELLASVQEAGLLDRPSGIWRLAGSLGAAPRLTELLRDRLSTTDSAARAALELLAVGQPLPLRAALKLVGGEVLEALERRGLVTVDVTGRRRSVRLSHPLYAELLRADTPELARLRYSRRLADAIQGLGTRRSGDVMRVALWRLDGGGTLDTALMLEAAQQAALVREYALAERLARSAYESAGGILAGLAAVRARCQLGRVEDALALCVELGQTAAGDGERAMVAVQHASVLAHFADDVHAGLAVLDSATVSDPDWREHLDVVRLCLRSYQLDSSVADPAVRAFRTGRSVETRIAAAGIAGTTLMIAGRFTESLALIEEALPLAARHTGTGRMYADGMPVAQADIHAHLPDPARAEPLAEAAYESSLHPADRVSQALSALTLAKIALLRGRAATALRWAAEARVAAGEVRMREVCRWASAVRLQAATQLEAVTEAAEAAADLDRHASGAHATRLFDIEVARGLAWQAALAGDRERARTVLGDEVARHGELGAVGAGTLGVLDLVRLGEAEQAVRLLKAYPPPDSWALGRIVVRYATAAVAGDAAGLFRIAREFGGHGMPLHAAEAATLAAAAWRAGGDPRAGSRARLLADRELARCERAVTPALRSGGPASELTGRERELALAAARGESTRNIAARLHLSVRTVDNHLHRAYAKLGVAGRAELRAALSSTE